MITVSRYAIHATRDAPTGGTRVKTQNQKRLAAALILIGLGAVIPLCQFGWKFSAPDSACARVPRIGITSPVNGARLRIIEPRHGSDVKAIYIFRLLFDTGTFKPAQPASQVRLWIDGVPVHAAHISERELVIGVSGLRKAGVGLADRTQDICLVLLDSAMTSEIARAGARISLQWRGSDQVDFSWIFSCCGLALAVVFVAPAVVAVFQNRRV